MFGDLLQTMTFGKVAKDKDGKEWILISTVGMSPDGKEGFYLAVEKDVPVPADVKFIILESGQHLKGG